MADDPGEEEAEDERALELQTVAAIYPELAINTHGELPFSALIDLAVTPVEPLPVRFPAADRVPLLGPLTPPDSTSEGDEQRETLSQRRKVLTVAGNELEEETCCLSHLPPLTLRIRLPDGYPNAKPPVFQLDSTWLPSQTLERLRGAGNTIWEEMGRDQVIFSYIDHLREAAERGFGYGQGIGGVLELPLALKVALLDFDLKAKRETFESETYECGICLEPKKGLACHRLLSCSHVFCIECLQDFYNSLITEGDVGNVKCMAPYCGKHPDDTSAQGIDRTLEPSELLQIPLEQETVQRYVKLKRKKRLESDRSTIWCPRTWCQGPAVCPNRKKGEDGAIETFDKTTKPELLPPPAERLAICEDCTLAFCIVCKKSWHGEFFVCFPRDRFELTEEEQASEKYMMLHTQPCPTCSAPAQKTHGCNHMICFKCNTHFCYLCGSYLLKDNPYQHYNTIKSSCYMRLWELESGDDGDFGHGFDGGAHDVLDGEDRDDDDDNVGNDVIEGMGQPIDLRAPLPIPPAPPVALAAQARAQVRAPPAQIPDPPGVPRAPAPGQDNRRRGAAPPGLQRALQMIENDEEDEWDSDEMEEEDEELFNWN